MSQDSEEIIFEEAPVAEKNTNTKKPPDDFLSIIVDKIYGFDWFMLLAVAISYLIIVSDLYQERVIQNIKNATGQSGDLTTFGYMFQLLSLLIGTIILRIMFGIARSN